MKINFKLVLSMLGNIALSNGYKVAWLVLILANILWGLYFYRKNEKSSFMLSMFYALNGLFALYNGGM